MRRLLLIGVGAGDPGYVTAQAASALNEVDVFFVVDKGGDADELVAFRRLVLGRFVEEPAFRIVELPDPPRDRASDAYLGAVEDWRARRADLWCAALRDELEEDGVGAFLVWGDPSLYDSTIDIVERIQARGGVGFDYEVIPGVSSIHALTARHRIPLNRVGGAVEITTGRRLETRGWPEGVDDLVVMLDAKCSFASIDPEGVDIYWGAYLGTSDELLVAGPLREVAGEIRRIRAAARERKGWIMDTYLLRRERPDGGEGRPSLGSTR